jgi:hypothetical protein
MTAFPFARRLPALRIDRHQATSALLLAAALLLAVLGATAATNDGTALQEAFETLDGMANGYGKQILILMGFVMCGIAFIATNAAGVVMKFIGYAIFLGAGLGAAVNLVGAVI